MRRVTLAKRPLVTMSLFVAALGACGGTGAFTLSSDDNNPAALAKAFAVEKKPTAGQPANGTGKPMAFFVTAGAAAQKKLIAWDLAAGKQAWAVEADVTSRVVVGAGFVAAREGKSTIVARDVSTGQKRWAHELGDKVTFLGAAADGDKVFYVKQDDTGRKRTWKLVALGSGGSVAWQAEAPGTLGAPAARGGLVFMPFLTQWLTILDASSGEQLARIRQTDEAVNFVRATSDGVFYGSKGIFLLDENSVEGTRDGATYGAAKLPTEFVRTFYHWDAFSEVQAGYSAYDRNRILWRARAKAGQLVFNQNTAVVFTYRFFFGFDATTGALNWAHNHPRNDIVSADTVGDAIVYVSLEGELGALHVGTGALLFQGKVGARITGATFDAEGLVVKGDGTGPNTADALSSIIWDKDKRFAHVKLFAIDALGTLGGEAVTTALLRVLLEEQTPQTVYQKAAEVLVARKDATAVPMLVKALETEYDYIAGTRPRAVDVIARALGAVGRRLDEKDEKDEKDAAGATKALIRHLQDPQTPLAVVKDVAEALGNLGVKDALPALRSYLLVYRSDPMFASDAAALTATIDAILKLGGGGERELVAYVAEEDRTEAKVAEYARRALGQTDPAKAKDGAKAKKPAAAAESPKAADQLGAK